MILARAAEMLTRFAPVILILGAGACATRAVREVVESEGLDGLIKSNGYQPYLFPRTDYRPGTLLAEIDGSWQVLEPHDGGWLPPHLKATEAKGQWGNVEVTAATDQAAGVAFINPLIGGQALGAEFTRLGVTSFRVEVGPVFIETLPIGPTYRYLIDGNYRSGPLAGYLITEVVGTDRLVYDFGLSKTEGGGLTGEFARNALGLEASLGSTVQITGSQHLVIEERRLLGYKGVKLRRLDKGFLGTGEPDSESFAYEVLDPTVAEARDLQRELFRAGLAVE